MIKLVVSFLLLIFSHNAFTVNKNTALEELVSLKRDDFNSDEEKERKKKEARASIIRSEGLRYSAQQAFIKEMKLLISELEQYSEELDEVFDFRFLQHMATEQLKTGNELKSLSLIFQPPVIKEYENVRAVNSNRTIFRKAQSEFVIEEPARLGEQALNWREFLTMIPAEDLPEINIGALPSNDEEQKVWEESVRAGWYNGRKQARIEMERRLVDLMQSHSGMLNYIKLVDKGMVNAAEVILSKNPSEINATSTHLAVNVLRYTIKIPTSLNGNVNEWKSVLISGELQIRNTTSGNIRRSRYDSK